MNRFEVQSIELAVPLEKAMKLIAEPTQLPRWASAFASVTPGRAVLRTPAGEVAIELKVSSCPGEGTIDWRMAFQDGSVATAFSRLVAIDRDHCVYCFVLTPPPVPLERLEGALDAQARTLAGELRTLKAILEARG